MIRIVSAPELLNATVLLPASKSISNRLLVLRFLMAPGLEIRNLSGAGDTVLLGSLLEIVRQHKESGSREILRLDARDAGTALRFLIALLAVTPGHYYLTGTARMKQRPVGPLVEALRELGADVEYTERAGYPPLMIRGRKLSGSSLSVDASVSSQFISALMLIGPVLEDGLDIYFHGRQVSWPYVRMTASLLQQFGIKVMEERNCIRIRTGKPVFTEASAEPDWSAASFWYSMVAIAGQGSVFFPGLRFSGLQGDEQAADLFALLGVNTSASEEGVRIAWTGPAPESCRADFESCPDLALPFIVACGAAGIEGAFTGLSRLTIKESDRLAVLSGELLKIGRILEYQHDAWRLLPGKPTISRVLDIPDIEDHRVAMALSVLAIKGAVIEIGQPDAAGKSYPGFWDDLKNAGFTIVA